MTREEFEKIAEETNLNEALCQYKIKTDSPFLWTFKDLKQYGLDQADFDLGVTISILQALHNTYQDIGFSDWFCRTVWFYTVWFYYDVTAGTTQSPVHLTSVDVVAKYFDFD